MSNEARIAMQRVGSWIASPLLFVREVFQVEPDAWQIDVLEALGTRQRLALKASKGVGKSTVLAWAVWWWLATRLNSKVACTSITSDNLRDGLWAELAKWMQRSHFLMTTFEWRAERIVAREAPEIWWAAARSWSRGADSSQQADSLAGLHADAVLVVLDEAGGIPDAVMAAAEGALANATPGSGLEAKLLIAGNPTHLEGPLYRACTSERQLWHVTEISSDPDDPKRASRVSADWAREQIEKFGRENPWVLVNVFGRFPPSSLNALLGPNDVATAVGRRLSEDQYSFAAKVIGVDVARFGDDRTVLFPRQGLTAFPPVIMRHAKTHEIAARIAAGVAKWDSDAVFIDDTGGYGAGVIDALEQGGISAIPVCFSGAATDPRYFNKRSEIWFEMADWVKKGAALPPIGELQRELTVPTYAFQGGRFRLEEKDQIKKRLGFSCDLGDALAISFAQPVLPRSGPGALRFQDHGPQKAITEYDPFG